MPPRRALRAVAAVSCLGLLLSLASARPVQGASLRSVPPDPGSTELVRYAVDAAVADLDGDGRPEVALLVPWSTDPGRLAVVVYRADASWYTAAANQEAPTPIGDVPLRRRLSVDEILAGIPHDREDMVPLLVNDQARLLTVRYDGGVHLLALVNARSPEGEQSPCCLTGWEVGLAAGGGGPTLRKVIDTQRGGDAAVVADMDGDGTDELAIHEPAAPPGEAAAVSVLRWDGESFRRRTLQPLEIGAITGMFSLGDTDGLPGAEIGFLGHGGTNEQPTELLTRVSLRNGQIHAEQVQEPGAGQPVAVAWPDLREGSALVVGGPTSSVTAYAWPADGGLARLAASNFTGEALGVIGSGAGARVLIQPVADASRLDMIAPGFGQETAQEIRATVAATRFQATDLQPYRGAWPSAGPSAAAFVFGGQLIEAAAAARPTVRAIASLPGAIPVGVAGEGRWMILLRGLDGAPVGEDPHAGHFLLGLPQTYSASIAAVADLATPEADGGLVVLPIAGTQPDPGDPAGSGVVTRSDGMRLVIQAPSATLVSTRLARLGGRPAVGVDAAPFLVDVSAPPVSAGRVQLTVRLVTPAGHGYLSQVFVRSPASPPSITARAALFSPGLSAQITGRTDPAATVAADGRSTRPDAGGDFQLDVPAGLVPRDVEVVATDPFGRSASILISVVAPLDYRQLPWVPIVVVLTVLVAVGLFLRAPAARHRAPATVDEGTFEELEIEER